MADTVSSTNAKSEVRTIKVFGDPLIDVFQECFPRAPIGAGKARPCPKSRRPGCRPEEPRHARAGGPRGERFDEPRLDSWGPLPLGSEEQDDHRTKHGSIQKGIGAPAKCRVGQGELYAVALIAPASASARVEGFMPTRAGLCNASRRKDRPDRDMRCSFHRWLDSI